MTRDKRDDWNQKIEDFEQLLLFVREHCQPHTCAAMTFGQLVRSFGDRSKAEAALKRLWKTKLVTPTGRENDPEDGALFLVKTPRIDRPLKDTSQFVLTDTGYAAIDPIFSASHRPSEERDEARDSHDNIFIASCFINSALMAELERDPRRMVSLSPREFEEFVAELFMREGFEVQLTPTRKDGGRDVLAVSFGPLGHHLYLTECKRFDPCHPVGVHYVRALYGVLERERATRGLIATTSYFTRGAQAFALDIKWRIGLKDYENLRAWFEKLKRGTS